MFNTLKEMQETIPYEDLCKYTYESLDKSPAEIKELLKSYNIEVSDSVAQECFDFMKDIDVISDDELENVAGGSCYSSETYESLGIAGSDRYAQKPHYHPLITTLGNSCKKHHYLDGNTCDGCAFLYKQSHTVTCYCNLRSKEYDPCKN